jgi:hypothetical protein
LDKYNKDIRFKDKTVRAKAAEISELKKRLSQLKNNQQSTDRDLQEILKNSKEFSRRVLLFFIFNFYNIGSTT